MDEIIRMIMAEAAKQTAQQGSKADRSSMNYDDVATIKKDVSQIAKFTKMLYDQFVAAGFTEEQAMKLTIAILNNKCNPK